MSKRIGLRMMGMTDDGVEKGAKFGTLMLSPFKIYEIQAQDDMLRLPPKQNETEQGQCLGEDN